MAIDDQQLLALAYETQDRNDVAMQTMEDELGEIHFGETAEQLRDARRRRIVGKAILGVPLVAAGSSLLPLSRFMPAAWAASGLNDADIAKFAATTERAAVQAYKVAAGTGKLNATEVQVGTMFADQHAQHAAAFEAILKIDPVAPNKKVLEVFGPKITGAADDKAILEVAFDIENGAAATYLFALGALQTASNAAAAATILPIESMHAVALGTVLNKDLTDLVPPFETDKDALKPVDYPAAG